MKKNKFDERYEIRLANKDDVEAIMKFIDEHWRKGHILATCRELFDYEYVDGEQVNFVLAIERDTKEIEGIFGFLPCSHTQDISKKDIWGSLWKVNDKKENMPLLGIELAKRVYELTGCRYQIGNGANPKTTVPLRKLFFREKTERMKQYYLLNQEIETYEIAKINRKVKQISLSDKIVSVKEYKSMEQLRKDFDVEKLDVIPYKDNWYIEKRYFKHPIYSYKVFGLSDNKDVKAILVTREVSAVGKKILRIVDYLGQQELFEGINAWLQKYMIEKNYEYVDFVTLGFEEKYVLSAGFTHRNEDDGNIIPNYFEPFVQENVDIWAHYKEDGTLFFKADGDQDRPNIK